MAYQSNQSTGECLPQSKCRPRMPFTIRWSVADGRPHTHAEVDLPLRRHVQVGHRKDLLLLLVQPHDDPIRP